MSRPLSAAMNEYSVLEGSRFPRNALPRSARTIVLEGKPSNEINEDLVADVLRNTTNIEVIERLEVAPSSRLRSLSFLGACAHIKHLGVFGRCIETLDGIEKLRQPERLTIDTGPNKTRSIAAMANSRFREIELICGRDDDVELAAGCRALEGFLTLGCRVFDAANFARGELKHLALERTGVAYLADTRQAAHLRTVFITRSPGFKGFEGDNSGLERVLIESCAAFRLESLGSCPGLQALQLSKPSKGLRLRSIPPLHCLQSLFIGPPKLDIRGADLAASFPALKEFWLFGATREELATLSGAAPAVAISNGRFTFRAGIRIK